MSSRTRICRLAVLLTSLLLAADVTGAEPAKRFDWGNDIDAALESGIEQRKPTVIYLDEPCCLYRVQMDKKFSDSYIDATIILASAIRTDRQTTITDCAILARNNLVGPANYEFSSRGQLRLSVATYNDRSAEEAQ